VGAWEPRRGAERDFPHLDCDARERERDRGSPFGRDQRDERPIDVTAKAANQGLIARPRTCRLGARLAGRLVAR